MRYKLLALDIDGTIVKPHNNTPSPETIKAIQKAKQKVYISLVSARAWKDHKSLVHLLGLQNNYHVLENGTKVISPSGDIEYDLRIPAREVKDIVKVSKGLYDDAGFCIQGMWTKEYAKDSVSTISFISHSRKSAEKIPQALNRLSNKYVFSVGAHWSEPGWAVTLISHKDASKGTGLAYIQNKLKINPSETIAVGDGASDVSAMRYAGVKAAMGNAEPELLKTTNYIAPSVDKDGLVNIINKFIL